MDFKLFQSCLKTKIWPLFGTLSLFLDAKTSVMPTRINFDFYIYDVLFVLLSTSEGASIDNSRSSLTFIKVTIHDHIIDITLFAIEARRFF